MRVALVHDWLLKLGGAEKCLEAFAEIYPEAPLFTLAYSAAAGASIGIPPSRVLSSPLNRIPFGLHHYQYFLPLYPLLAEQFDLRGYDVILSSSHCVAKGVLTQADQVHVGYCHTPMRYAWDLTLDYLEQNGFSSGARGSIVKASLHYLRLWDVASANRVDHFVANSKYTARRIRKIYSRESQVIYPPVDVERIRTIQKKDNHFVFMSRLVPYKRADLVITAFNDLKVPLVIIGDGPHMKYCKSIANKNIDFVGYIDDQAAHNLVARARALVFAADEDFGIVPVEAQALGTPVIAFGRGGVTETVIPYTPDRPTGATGLFYSAQSVASIKNAVAQFSEVEHIFNPAALHQQADRFSVSRFKSEIISYMKRKAHN